MGINSFKDHYYRKNLILITENYDLVKKSDIGMPLSGQDNSLTTVMKTSKKFFQNFLFVILIFLLISALFAFFSPLGSEEKEEIPF